MKGLLYFVLAYGNPVFDRCMQASGSLDACSQAALYAPQNYPNLLGSYGYPILRDKSCERGRCLAHFYANECEVCEDEACRRKCLEKKSNTKELLEFLKEVIVSRYKNSSPSQYEIINTVTVEKPSTVTVTEQPQRAVSASSSADRKCETASQPPRAAEPATAAKNEVRTVTVESSRVEPGRGGAGQPPARGPCTNPLVNVTECFGILQSIERQIRSTANPPLDGGAGKKRRPACASEEDKCDAETRPKRRKRGRDSDSGSSERSSTPKTGGAGTQSMQKFITLTRTVDKTVTVSEPITLFREYTTTVVKEKPIINYKISTFTSTEYRTVVKASKEGDRSGESTGAAAESTRPEKSVPKTIDIPCRGPSCDESLGSLLRKCEQLKGCREMLLGTRVPAEQGVRTAEETPAAEGKTVTKMPEPAAPGEPKVVYRTETVRTTVTVASASEPAKTRTGAVTTTESQPEAVVTRTVSVSVYKTLREEADTETVYRTVTKKVRRPQARTASRLCDEPERKHRSLALRCKLNMTDCRPSGGGKEEPQPAGKEKGGRRTIVNTIYSIQKSQSGDESNDSITKTVYVS